jgi:hypothetical protein
MDYNHAVKHLAKAIYPEQIDMVIKPNNPHHILIKTINKKKYYLLKKELPFQSAGEIFKDNKGYRESINSIDLIYCINTNVDKICFIYPNRIIYWIEPLDFQRWGKARETDGGEVTCSVPLNYLRRLE